MALDETTYEDNNTPIKKLEPIKLLDPNLCPVKAIGFIRRTPYYATRRILESLEYS